LHYLFPSVIVRKPRNSTDIPSAFFLHIRKNPAQSIASYFVYAKSLNEDELLRVFRALTADQQDLFIEQGKLLLAYSKKSHQD